MNKETHSTGKLDHIYKMYSQKIGFMVILCFLVAPDV